MLGRAVEVAYKTAAAAGVEPRYPFLDRSLATFSLTLPATQRYREGWTRYISRRALKGVLTDAVRTRYGKANLQSNFTASVFGSSREELETTLYERLPLASPFLDVSAVQAAYRRAVHSPEAQAELAAPLWRAALLAHWLSGQAEGQRRPAAGIERMLAPAV